MCYENFRLYLCYHYINAPGLPLDVMLKTFGAKSKLFSNADIYICVEKEITGAISYIAHRYNRVKYLNNYKENQKIKYLIYLDMNSFYAKVRSKYLLISGLRWLTDKEIENFDFSKIHSNL